MKILGKRIDKGSGHAKLVPENSEDIWYIYQLIQPNDTVKATSYRKVVLNENSSNPQTTKVKTSVCIVVETIDSETKSIRIRGKNCQENEYIKLGAYHTITVMLGFFEELLRTLFTVFPTV
ncbi:hypothetical protein ACOME3_007487 [Neoechinorhynchus agilis]